MQRTGRPGSLNDRDALSAEQPAHGSLVRLVATGVTVAHADYRAAAANDKRYLRVGIIDRSILIVHDLCVDHHDILAIR